MIDITVVTPEWLTYHLTTNGYLHRGEVTVVTVESIHKHHCLLTLQYSKAAFTTVSHRLLLKMYDTAYAWGAREGIFYAEVAPLMPDAPLPHCYAVVLRNELGKTAILLEDLSTTHAVTSAGMEGKLDSATWRQVIDTYLALHTFWWEHPRISQGNFVRSFGLGVAHEATSVDLMRANHRHFIEQAFPRWLASDGQHFSAEWHCRCEQIIDTWADLFIRRTAAGKALTMIHGDAHWQNVLLPHQPADHRPIIIDWEGFTRGVGVWDLSRLLISSVVTSEQRQKLEAMLLPYYHSRLVDAGITNYSLQECYEDYRLSLLANVLLSFDFGDLPYMTAAKAAFSDWNCEEMIK